MGIQKALFLLAVVAAGPLFAQTDDQGPAPAHGNTLVYKCKNDDGSVTYSENECSKDPKKMEVVDTRGALRTGSGGHQGEISASVADSDCRDKAYRSTHPETDTNISESNRHIADYQQRQREVQDQSVYGDNRKSIDDLDAAIARESEYQQKEISNREVAYENALRACDEMKKNASAAPAGAPAPRGRPAATSPTATRDANGGGN